MANRGNPKFVVRAEPRLVELMRAEVDRTNQQRAGEPFTVSAWIRQAIIDKLRHSARSRRRRSYGEKRDTLESSLAELNAFPTEGV